MNGQDVVLSQSQKEREVVCWIKRAGQVICYKRSQSSVVGNVV